MKYDAFLSYSHKADGYLAPAVQRALHQFARPWYRIRAVRVFRDQTSLSATPELWASIQRALGESKHFILFASPGAADSPWVGQEIRWWLEHRSSSTMMLVLTDGELVWDVVGEDFDWSRTTALPGVATGAFSAEPLWVDLRWANDSERLSIKDPEFARAIADLASVLHDRPKDDMVGEDVRQWKRTRRIIAAVIASLTVLLVTATAAALVAIDRQDEAERQRSEAEAQASIARSRQLAAEARALLDEDLDLGLLLAVESHIEKPTSEARAVLLDGLGTAPALVRFLHGHAAAVEDIAANPDTSLVTSVDAGGNVFVWDLDRGTSTAFAIPGLEDDVQPALGPRGDTVGFVDSSGQLNVWELGDSEARSVNWAPELAPGGSLRFSPDGRFLATATPQGQALLLDTQTRSVLEMNPLGGDGTGNPRGYQFSPDGRWLAFTTSLGVVALVDLTTGLTSTAEPQLGLATALSFSPDGSAIVLGSGAGDVVALAVPSLQRTTLREPDPNVTEFTGLLQDVYPVAYRPDGTAFLLGGPDGSVLIWNELDGSTRPTALPLNRESITMLSFVGESTVLIADRSGLIEQWDLDRAPTAGLALTSEVTIAKAVAISPDTDLVAVGGCDASALEDLGDAGLECSAGYVSIHPTAGGPSIVVSAHSDFVQSAVFSADSKTLFTGASDGRIIAWDRDSGTTKIISDQGSTITDLAVRPGHDEVASTNFNGAVAITSLESSRTEYLLEAGDVGVGGGPFEWQTAVAFSPDGQTLYAGSREGKIRSWTLSDGAEGNTIDYGRLVEIADLDVSPDGSTLAAVVLDFGDRRWTIRLFDTEDLTESAPPIEDALLMGALQFTPDGSSLAYSSARGLVFWNLARQSRVGAPLSPASGSRQAVDVGGSPEAPVWAQADESGATLWHMSDRAMVERACARANRSLTETERNRFELRQDGEGLACADIEAD